MGRERAVTEPGYIWGSSWLGREKPLAAWHTPLGEPRVCWCVNNLDLDNRQLAQTGRRSEVALLLPVVASFVTLVVVNRVAGAMRG
jgi:hypothetical protein